MSPSRRRWGNLVTSDVIDKFLPATGHDYRTVYAQIPGFSWFSTNYGNIGANLEKYADPEEAVREWIYDKKGKIVRFDK